MIKTAQCDDSADASKLAIELWPNHNFEDLQEEVKKIILHKNALIALYFQNNNPIAFVMAVEDVLLVFV